MYIMCGFATQALLTCVYDWFWPLEADNKSGFLRARSQLIHRRVGLRSYSTQKTLIRLSNELGQDNRSFDLLVETCFIQSCGQMKGTLLLG